MGLSLNVRLKHYTPYILIVSILVADIIIFTGLTKMFFESDNTITAGVLGLIGAVIGGGAFTLIGVKWTLESQFQRDNQKQKEELRTYLSASAISFNFETDQIIGRF